MKMKLLVFKLEYSKQTNNNSNTELLSNYRMSVFKPNITNLHKQGEGFLVNLFWFIISYGKFKILHLFDSENIVHYSYITPAVYRFPFMKANDMQIGPCLTFEKYQKRGIYAAVLRYLISEYNHANRTLWIYCNENNHASRKAIEKVGFEFVGFANIHKLTKVIKIAKF